jgi:hypothetical protein
MEPLGEGLPIPIGEDPGKWADEEFDVIVEPSALQ